MENTCFISLYAYSRSNKYSFERSFYVDNLIVLNSEEPEIERIYIWSMDSEEEIGTFGNDNTGQNLN